MTSAPEARAELDVFGAFYGALAAQQYFGDHICCAAQPEDANGSVEDLVAAGVDEAAVITGRWAEQIVEAVSDRSTVGSILTTLGGLELDLGDFARVVGRGIVHSAMLGALDSVWEREHDEEIAPARFAVELREGAFSSLPYADAVGLFQRRQVLPRPAFDALAEGASRTAFTVARMASQEMLNVTKAELARQLNLARSKPVLEQDGVARRPGLNLRDFKRFAKERLESAGWTPANKSHVETVFRTNALGALASGRFVEMRKPDNLRALPLWQIRGVNDSRARPTHKAAFNIVLPANHPFWLRAYPPFGYNCRCRVVARTMKWLERMGLRIGPVPTDLPDEGFDSGTRALISVPDDALREPPRPEPAPPGPTPLPPAPPPRPAPPPVIAPPAPPAPVFRPPPDATEAAIVEHSRKAAAASMNPLVSRAKEFAKALKKDPAEVRQLARDQVTATLPNAHSKDKLQGRAGRTSFQAQTDKFFRASGANRNVEAWHSTVSGEVVVRRHIRDGAAQAADLLAKGVYSDPRLEKLFVSAPEEYTKRFRTARGKRIDPITPLVDLKTIVHEELHGHSRVGLHSYRGIGAILEEVGTELNARHVIQNLTPEIARNPVLRAKFSSTATVGSYQRQIDAVCDIVAKHAGVNREAAGELVRAAHQKGVLASRGPMFETAEDHLTAFVEALDVSPERAQLIRQELSR